MFFKESFFRGTTRRFAAVSACLVFGGTVFGAVASGNGVWGNASLWTTGVVPGGTEAVYIRNGRVITIPAGYAAAAKSVSLSNANKGHSVLEVFGSLTATGGVSHVGSAEEPATLRAHNAKLTFSELVVAGGSGEGRLWLDNSTLNASGPVTLGKSSGAAVLTLANNSVINTPSLLIFRDKVPTRLNLANSVCMIPGMVLGADAAGALNIQDGAVLTVSGGLTVGATAKESAAAVGSVYVRDATLTVMGTLAVGSLSRANSFAAAADAFAFHGGSLSAETFVLGADFAVGGSGASFFATPEAAVNIAGDFALRPTARVTLKLSGLPRDFSIKVARVDAVATERGTPKIHIDASLLSPGGFAVGQKITVTLIAADAAIPFGNLAITHEHPEFFRVDVNTTDSRRLALDITPLPAPALPESNDRMNVITNAQANSGMTTSTEIAVIGTEDSANRTAARGICAVGGFRGLRPAPGHSLAGTESVYDWLVQDIAIDAKGNPTNENPLTATRTRNFEIGDKLPYYMSDYPVSGEVSRPGNRYHRFAIPYPSGADQNGDTHPVVAGIRDLPKASTSDEYNTLGIRDLVSMVGVFPNYACYMGAYIPRNDGYSVSVGAGYANENVTGIGRLAHALFPNPVPSGNALFHACVLQKTISVVASGGVGESGGTDDEIREAENEALKKFPAHKANSLVPQFVVGKRLRHVYGTRDQKTKPMDTVISTLGFNNVNAAGTAPIVGNPSVSVERIYITREFGYATRWEQWKTYTGESGTEEAIITAAQKVYAGNACGLPASLEGIYTEHFEIGPLIEDPVLGVYRHAQIITDPDTGQKETRMWYLIGVHDCTNIQPAVPAIAPYKAFPPGALSPYYLRFYGIPTPENDKTPYVFRRTAEEHLVYALSDDYELTENGTPTMRGSLSYLPVSLVKDGDLALGLNPRRLGEYNYAVEHSFDLRTWEKIGEVLPGDVDPETQSAIIFSPYPVGEHARQFLRLKISPKE